MLLVWPNYEAAQLFPVATFLTIDLLSIDRKRFHGRTPFPDVPVAGFAYSETSALLCRDGQLKYRSINYRYID